MSAMCPISVPMVFKNLRRAGVLKKSCFTVTMVPLGAPTSETSFILPPSTTISVPLSADAARVIRLNRETAAILGRASPLKPRVLMEKRSRSLKILLVA